MRLLNLILPWPPSANTYWRRNGSRYFISKKGLDYRKHTAFACLSFQDHFSAEDRIKLSVYAYPPDKRKRDLDNVFKCLIDSLQHARIFPNDFQIDMLSIVRMNERLGKMYLTLEKID